MTAGFLLITSPFVAARPSQRDHSDGFDIVRPDHESMRDQHDDQAVDQSNCLPPLLALLEAILGAERERIGEHADRKIEPESMLDTIGSFLLRVPLEAQMSFS